MNFIFQTNKKFFFTKNTMEKWISLGVFINTKGHLPVINLSITSLMSLPGKALMSSLRTRRYKNQTSVPRQHDKILNNWWIKSCRTSVLSKEIRATKQHSFKVTVTRECFNHFKHFSLLLRSPDKQNPK